MEFSFISPEVTVASIGPDLSVFPVIKEKRSKAGVEAPAGSEGFCVGASEFLVQSRAAQGDPVRDNSRYWKTKQKCKCTSDYLNKDKLRRQNKEKRRLSGVQQCLEISATIRVTLCCAGCEGLAKD